MFTSWRDYENDEWRDQGIIHTELIVVSSAGRTRKIGVSRGQGRLFCFKDFSDLAYCPSIFRAKTRLVSYCHCSSNWDGLMNSSILTVDIAAGQVHNQYWQTEWLDQFSAAIPEGAGDAENWSNGGLRLYLNNSEDQLLIHGDYDGKFEASILFRWAQTQWEFAKVIPGGYPNFNSKERSHFRGFTIGVSSLTRHR